MNEHVAIEYVATWPPPINLPREREQLARQRAGLRGLTGVSRDLDDFLALRDVALDLTGRLHDALDEVENLRRRLGELEAGAGGPA